MNTRRLLLRSLAILTPAVAVLWLAWFFLTAPAEVEKYPWGRGTMDSFGDGRFQIDRSYPHRRGLFDGQKQKSLLDTAFDWRTAGDMVCAVGTDGETVWHPEGKGYWGPRGGRVYLVLNCRTGAWHKYKRLEEVPARYQAQAGKLQTQ